MEQEGTSLMEPTGAAPLRPTDLREIGPYRLLGRLGEGGMGTVFLARAPTGRFVALKVVKAEFANQEGFAARFHGEVENARRVASFCTAQVLDNGNTGDGRPYMVTEYIAGTPLSDQIAKYGALDPGPLHGVALGVAAALAAIHVAGLVHRDLKPANVILSLSGPRVIDFGIARALDRETGFTLSGELLGSPGWWAPEQVRGEMVSPAADIFAWGCLVAYAGNGRHPFGRGDPITMAHRVLNTPPELGALPAPLNELARQATSMDPALRPTAQDLLIALVGGNTPPPSVNPPTLVATEMLSDWQPPQNVVNEPDVTATFTTPPPSDTMGKPAQPSGPNLAPGAVGWPGAGVPGGPPPGAARPDAASFEELARREEQAAKEELARWPAQGQAQGGAPGPEQPGSRGLFRRGDWKKGRQEPAAAPGASDDQPQQMRQTGPAAPEARPRQTAPGVQGAAPGAQAQRAHLQGTQGQGAQGQAAPSQPGPAGPVRPQEGQPSQPGPQELQGSLPGRPATDTQPGDRATRITPELLPSEPDTLGGTRTSGTRWLVAAAAAVLAIVVTVAVLIVTSGRNTVTSTAGNPSQGASATASPNDVGRRFPLGDNFDDPIAIVAAAPECGLKEYEGKTATQGQLCVIRWTMLNPGGERKVLVQPVVTMVDDRGGEHDAAAVTLPPAILPGARVDSAFVFDLANYRKPVKLTATMLENGKQIEVAL
ncbi:serine/threonine protein kinase [Nonomuraea polychroma]|uniref:serine/threonine protein kinase n=1 Tax=Nonomuraea polychroma TaxID=46176 RepID=UPI003D8FF4C4